MDVRQAVNNHYLNIDSSVSDVSDVSDQTQPSCMNKVHSFLFITYNRSELLTKSFTSLREAVLALGLPVEFVVSDDASSLEHQVVINSLGFDVLSISDINRGLGANQNRGIASCKGGFIFQIQDDWIFVGQPSDLTDAVQVMESDPEVGIVQLTDVSSDLPSERRITRGGVMYDVFRNDQLPWDRDCGLRPYSDHPHVKRISFVKEIGSYLEGVAMGVMENDYKRRIATQKRWRVAQMTSKRIFIDYEAEHSLNPGGKRHELVVLLHKIPFVGKWIEWFIRQIWRRVDHLAAVVIARLSA
ncbi:glycosyltransferase family 2 protein [Methylococcus mesophilus]|uniref:glycosyltransferase family 2 protein n=1 Tax=Methylococcus mesophilus TaxID=2993564 RepID=UPI00224B1F2E|nr:glycosyltransferase family 2 protein [Methylococcus mesophilus]UZR28730.1 glycosyltransferase family 2 protein [Methylococcus mesophilus]